MITFKELSEAHKVGDKVTIKGGPKDVKGKSGRIGEIRKGLYKGAPKTFTVDYDHNETTGQAKSVQLKSKHIQGVKEQVENLQEKHRVAITLSDPNHPAVTKRKELIQKTVRVKADNPGHAVDSAIHHFRKAGYKVHDHNYIGTVKEELEEAISSAEERGGADKHYGRKYNNPHEVGSQEHKDYHKGYHTTDSEKDYGTSKGKPMHTFKSTVSESALERFRKAAAEREKKHDEIERKRKEDAAQGKENMSGAIDRLAKQLNKEEVEQIDEISDTTASSYIHKRNISYVKKMKPDSQGRVQPSDVYDKMSDKHKQGVGRALNRLMKPVSEEADLEEGTFKYHMDKAVAAHDRGDEKKKAYHLDNAKQARYSIKTSEYSKHKELFAKYKSMTEGSELEEARGLADKYYKMAQDRKETAHENKGNHEVYHTHMADHHDAMSRYHEELGQHSLAQAHADKADIHHEKSMQKNEATDLRAQLQKHSDAAIAANKAGDDEKVKHHMNKMNAIKDKMAKAVTEEAPANNVGGGNIAGTQGDAGKKTVMTKKPMKRNVIQFKEFADAELEEGKTGLWANIHAKRKRIKAGSGERMRKPGSKGAPTAQDFKDAQEDVEVQFDMIEDFVEQLASLNNVDSEKIWEDLETVDDDELLEYAIDAKGHKSSEGGLTQKGVDAYNKKTGGNLKTAVTTPPSKLKPGSKAANRRKSFCARMGGMKKRLTSAKTANDPDSRINKALRKWNC